MERLFNEIGFLRFLKKDPIFLLEKLDDIIDDAIKYIRNPKNNLEKTVQVQAKDGYFVLYHDGKHYILLDVYYFPNRGEIFSDSIHCILIMDLGIQFSLTEALGDKKSSFSYPRKQTLENLRLYLVDRKLLLGLDGPGLDVFEIKLSEHDSTSTPSLKAYDFKGGHEVGFSSGNIFKEVKESPFFFL